MQCVISYVKRRFWFWLTRLNYVFLSVATCSAFIILISKLIKRHSKAKRSLIHERCDESEGLSSTKGASNAHAKKICFFRINYLLRATKCCLLIWALKISKTFFNNFNVLDSPKRAKVTENRDFSWKWPVFCLNVFIIN